jgi:dGTPase
VVQRSKRRHSSKKAQFPDHRTPFGADRDRILYTDAFRRLGGVTQVAGPNENHQFHNRLSHSLKVAQIAERLAQCFIGKSLRLDLSVVIAAALAHDLGHPPFGHIAEHELDILVKNHGNPKGYEGNAQTFRILTKLATHQNEYFGLNLTRATLNAVLKYPWKRNLDAPEGKEYRKFGYYSSEEEDFQFARQGFKLFEAHGQSLEAQIMDYADEVTYSIHDFEDFYRAGLIPVGALQYAGKEFDDFLRRWSKRKSIDYETLITDRAFYLDILARLPEHYDGSKDAQIQLRNITSVNIGEAVNSPVLQGNLLVVDQNLEKKHLFLQQLIWDYVVTNPRLASQQEGQRRIIRTLFETYQKALLETRFDLLPTVFQAIAEELPARPKNTEAPNDPRHAKCARIAADIVSSFTDQQALTIYQRIIGIAPGAITDLLQ